MTSPTTSLNYQQNICKYIYTSTHYSRDWQTIAHEPTPAVCFCKYKFTETDTNIQKNPLLALNIDYSITLGVRKQYRFIS